MKTSYKQHKNKPLLTNSRHISIRSNNNTLKVNNSKSLNKQNSTIKTPLLSKPLAHQTSKRKFNTSTENMIEDQSCSLGCSRIDGTPQVCTYNQSLTTIPNQFSTITPQQIINLDPSTLPIPICLDILRGKVIELEGNISCGKSTLTKHIQNLFQTTPSSLSTSTLPNKHTTPIPSPTTTTTNTSNIESTEISTLQPCVVHSELVNQDFLKAFYTNREQYGFAFQMYMLTTRLFQMETASMQSLRDNQCTLLDRGAVGDALFALYNHQTKGISDEEMGIYKSVCASRLPPSLSDKVHMVVYLDASPRECHRRMSKIRQHEAEEGVVPDYLIGLDHSYFELMIKWLGHRPDACQGIDIGVPPAVVVFDWENFGCTKSLIQVITRAALSIQHGLEQAIKPSVSFYDGEFYLEQSKQQNINNNTSNITYITTQDELHIAYEQLQSKLKQQSELAMSTQDIDSSVPSSLFAARFDVSAPKEEYVINWGLIHNNDFRRFCMKQLAQENIISYYNAEVSSDYPTD